MYHALTEKLFKDQFGQFLLSQHLDKFDSIIRTWLEEKANELVLEAEHEVFDHTPQIKNILGLEQEEK